MMIGDCWLNARFCSLFFSTTSPGKSIKVPWKSRSGEHASGKFEVSPDGRFVLYHLSFPYLSKHFFRFLAFRGSHGNIHIVSAKTKELLKTLKMNDECQDLVFSGSELWTTGAGGEVRRYPHPQIWLKIYSNSGLHVGSADVHSVEQIHRRWQFEHHWACTLLPLSCHRKLQWCCQHLLSALPQVACQMELL